MLQQRQVWSVDGEVIGGTDYTPTAAPSEPHPDAMPTQVEPRPPVTPAPSKPKPVRHATREEQPEHKRPSHEVKPHKHPGDEHIAVRHPHPDEAIKESTPADKTISPTPAPAAGEKLHRHDVGFMHPHTHPGVPIYGKASTYNPFKPGWKSGGPKTATGERYSETVPSGAIQMGLRGRFGGVHGGQKPHYALVEQGGKKLVVKVNDVMPYGHGRVIDLNESAMRYFDPSMKKGVLSGVRVTPLGTNPSGRADAIAAAPTKPSPHWPSTAHPEHEETWPTVASSTPSMPITSAATTSGKAGALPHARGVNMNLTPQLANRLSNAYKDMPQHVKDNFKIISGFRPATKAQARALGMPESSSQEDIWRRSGGGRRFAAARPGHSRHQRGEAADIASGPGLEWLHQHGHHYGLHFPVRRDYPHIQADPRWHGVEE